MSEIIPEAIFSNQCCGLHQGDLKTATDLLRRLVLESSWQTEAVNAAKAFLDQLDQMERNTGETK